MADILRRKVSRKSRLTHIDAQGRARMVDVGAKRVTRREAVATGVVRMQPETLAAILSGSIAKGEVLAVARVAGIQAAKRTSETIPMCHPLLIESVRVELTPDGDRCLAIEARVRVTAKTGVEMEALTAVAAAALTVYDMCKAIDRGMQIDAIQLIEKKGGRSGTYRRAATMRKD